MFSKSVFFKFFPNRWPSKNTKSRIDTIRHINGVYSLMTNSFCTMTEPPELPGWVKFNENQNPSAENADDKEFVLPSASYWVENHELQEKKTEIKSIVSDIMETDVDKVSKILKNRIQSTDDVVKALNGCSVSVSPSLVDQILKRFSNDWIPAFGFFNWARSQMGLTCSADLYNSMVDILGKCRRFDLMWELVEEMNKIKGFFTLITMTKVMRRLAKACKYEDAIEAFRRIEQFGVKKDVGAMNALMDSLVKGNCVEHAQDVYLECKNSIPPNSRTFNVLIHGWCKYREIEKARKTILDMKKHGFCPDVVTYTCFVEAYCREKDFRKVDAVLKEMQENGCPPSSVTYTIIMHTLGKAKELNKALEIYEKMKQSGCVPDSAFYSSLIYVLSKSGRLKDAREVFDEMPERGVSPDILTYNTMITTACEHSQEENALKLLKEMETSGCKPDHRTYAPLLKLFCRNQRMKVLSFLLKHMFENSVSPEHGTYTLLVRGLCNSGELKHACLFFEEMVMRGFVPMDCTFEMLKKGLERKGMEKAKAQVQELVLQAKSERYL